MPLMVELLKANSTLPFAVFLTFWIETSTSSGLAFCLRSFKVCAYIIPAPGIITTELTIGLFFQAWEAGILLVPTFSPPVFFFYFVLFFFLVLTSTKSFVVPGVPDVFFFGCLSLSLLLSLGFQALLRLAHFGGQCCTQVEPGLYCAPCVYLACFIGCLDRLLLVCFFHYYFFVALMCLIQFLMFFTPSLTVLLTFFCI